MANLFYAKISSVNYEDGTANVTLQDREEQVISDVPFLSMFYEMPYPGDTVAAIFEENRGQIEKGVILGKIFLEGNKPAENGPHIFYKQFTDGASMKYTPASKEMKFKTQKVVAENRMETKTLEAQEQIDTKILVADEIYCSRVHTR